MMRNKIQLLILIILLIPYNSFSKSYFISGGDILEKGSIKNNIIDHVDESDTVIFYKILSKNQHFYTTTNTVFMDLENKDTFCLFTYPNELTFKDFNNIKTNDLIIKERLISQKKWEDFFNSHININASHLKKRKKPTLFVEKSVFNFDVEEYKIKGFSKLNYVVLFENFGQFPIKEILYIDALPNNFQLKNVELLKSGLLGKGLVRDNDFEDIVWDIKKNNNLSYLIVKINFNKPFEGFLAKHKLFIRIKGYYYK